MSSEDHLSHLLGIAEIDMAIHHLLTVIPGIPGRPTQGNCLRRMIGVGLLGIPDATGLETGITAVVLRLELSEMDLLSKVLIPVTGRQAPREENRHHITPLLNLMGVSMINKALSSQLLTRPDVPLVSREHRATRAYKEHTKTGKLLYNKVSENS